MINIMNSYTSTVYNGQIPRGVMAKVLDFGLEVSEFEL